MNLKISGKAKGRLSLKRLLRNSILLLYSLCLTCVGFHLLDTIAGDIMAFKLSQRSLRNLEGVHPKLVECVKLALSLSEQDFTVVEGLRTLEQQKKNVAKGVSKTLKSYHLVGKAVDLYPFYNGSVQVEAPEKRFRMINEAMQKAANELGIKITWGGNWKSFQDTPHYQIEI